MEITMAMKTPTIEIINDPKKCIHPLETLIVMIMTNAVKDFMEIKIHCLLCHYKRVDTPTRIK